MGVPTYDIKDARLQIEFTPDGIPVHTEVERSAIRNQS